MNDLGKLKQEYNHNLTRLYNGCKYCEEHRNEVDKWLPELFKIYNKMNELLDEIMKYEQVSNEFVLGGFKDV